MPEIYRPGRHDLAITRYALGRAISSPELGLDSFEHIERSLTDAEREIHFGPLSQAQAATAKSVIDYLVKNKGLDEIAALNAAQAIDKLTQKSNVPKKADALKIPIEQVAEYARLEVQNIIGEETRNNLLPINLTTLENAVLNLNIIDGWTNDKTWLKDYLDRTHKCIKVWPQRDRFGFTHCNEIYFCKSGIVVMWYGYLDETYSRKVNPIDMQKEWDSGNRDDVAHLASLDRIKAAEKILRNIK